MSLRSFRPLPARRTPPEQSGGVHQTVQDRSVLGRSDRLFQRRVDRSEVGVQRGAKAVDRRDNGKRDAGRDQTIFNRGRPRLIRPELLKNVPQVRLRMSKWIIARRYFLARPAYPVYLRTDSKFQLKERGTILTKAVFHACTRAACELSCRNKCRETLEKLAGARATRPQRAAIARFRTRDLVSENGYSLANCAGGE